MSQTSLLLKAIQDLQQTTLLAARTALNVPDAALVSGEGQAAIRAAHASGALPHFLKGNPVSKPTTDQRPHRMTLREDLLDWQRRRVL